MLLTEHQWLRWVCRKILYDKYNSPLGKLTICGSNQNKINSTITKYLGVYSRNILHSNENEWTKTTHNNIAESHKNNAKQKNLDINKYILFDSLYTENKKRQN